MDGNLIVASYFLHAVSVQLPAFDIFLVFFHCWKSSTGASESKILLDHIFVKYCQKHHRAHISFTPCVYNYLRSPGRDIELFSLHFLISLPQDRKLFPQVSKLLPQDTKSFPQVSKSLPQDTKLFPQVSKSLSQDRKSFTQY